MSYSQAINGGVLLGAADLLRQAVSKGSINPKKSVAVGAASALADLTFRDWIQSVVVDSTNPDSEESKRIFNLIAEALSVAGALYLMDEAGVVSSANAKVGGGKKRGGKFGKALRLSAYDIAIRELYLMVMGAPSFMGGGDVQYQAPASAPQQQPKTGTTFPKYYVK